MIRILCIQSLPCVFLQGYLDPVIFGVVYDDTSCKAAKPKDLELSRAAARATVEPFSRIFAGQGMIALLRASRVRRVVRRRTCSLPDEGEQAVFDFLTVLLISGEISAQQLLLIADPARQDGGQEHRGNERPLGP